MKVGLYLDLRNPPAWRRPWVEHYGRWVELVEGADRAGLASVWLSEHHLFEDGYLPQPLTFAAALATRTRTMRIGTAVLLIGLRPSLLVAEEAAMVDLLSGGRVDLGVGAGYRKPEFDAYGVDVRRRFSLAEARLREVIDWWADERFSPKPVQQPIPMWGGFFGPVGARLSGRLGLGLLGMDPGLLPPYLEGRADVGAPLELPRMRSAVPLLVTSDPEAARARVDPHLAYQWDSYRRYGNEGLDPAAGATDIDRLADRGRAGLRCVTPDEAVAYVAELVHRVPVEEVFAWTSVAGMPDDMVEEHVSLLAERVAPAVRDLHPEPPIYDNNSS